jgi:pimeloyl-ACP methyl ester carboxylesterase
MNWTTFLLMALGSLASDSLEALELSGGYYDYYFTLPLDHINGDPGLISIKVLMHIGEPNAPLFVYAGNEAPIEFFYSMTGWLVYTLGPQYNATVAFIEHRYYGYSVPTPLNYAYLNTDQVLLDYASIIMQLKPMETTPVVVFGGQYGGMLAAFMRIKFPHLVDGAIASAAPVFEYLDEMGMGLMHQTTQDYFDVMPNCAFNINDGFNILDNFAENDYTWPGLSAIFQTCSPITEMGQVYDIEDWIANAMETIAQVNYPYPTQVEGYLPANPVNVSCSIVAVFNRPARNMWETVEALANVAFLLYNNSGTESCFTPWADNSDQNSLSWDYQTCTELLMPYGQYGVPYDMFPSRPWDYQTFNQTCYQNFGVYPNPVWYPINYGFTPFYMETMKNLSNIVFAYGSEDPWTTGCMKEAPNPNVHVIGIRGGAHHLDLMRPNANDPISVRFARRIENQLIQEWINI